MTPLPTVVVILGTFLPILGAGATVALAANTRGAYRWMTLVGGPALTWMLTDWLAPGVLANGNLLAVVIFLLFYVTITAYYPALGIAALVVWIRRRRRVKPGSSPR